MNCLFETEKLRKSTVQQSFILPFEVLDLERTRLSDPAAVMLNDMLIAVWVLDVLGNDFLLHENQNPESWKWNKMDGNGQLKSCKPCRMSKSASLRREAFPSLRCLSLRACRITDQGAVPLLRATCGRSFQRPWVATCHKVQVHTAHTQICHCGTGSKKRSTSR